MTTPKKPLPESPSQTAGPYVHIGCLPNLCEIEGIYGEDPGSRILTDETPGERIRISGCIYDAGGAPLLDAVVESWQADADGIPHRHDVVYLLTVQPTFRKPNLPFPSGSAR